MEQATLMIIPDRQLCAAAGGTGYLWLRVRGPASLPAERLDRKPLNLAFVLDRSGSMAGEKLALVKQAVAYGVNQLSPDDRATIVIFDNRVTVLAPSRLMTGDAKIAATMALGAVRDGGSTALGEGWLTGCRQIAETAVEQGGRWLTRALLLTDGLANVGITDPGELIDHAIELRRRGIMTTTFGVGADFDEHLLSGLAEAGNGNFYFISRADQIPACFKGELGELLTTWAEGMTLTLTLPAGLQATLLNDFPVSPDDRGATTHSESGERLAVAIGNLSAGEERDLLFELTIAPGTVDDPLAIGAELAYQQSATGERVEIAAPSLVLHYATAAAVAAETPDQGVLERAGRLQAAQAKHAAWEHVRAGRYQAAQATLTQAVDHLASPALSPAAPSLAQDAAELHDLARQAANGWDSETSKEAVYSSRLARKSRRDYRKA